MTLLPRSNPPLPDGATQPKGTSDVPKALTLPHSGRSMGIYCLSSRGTGKSTLLSRIGWQYYVSRILQVIFDPVGQTIDLFLDRTIRFLQHVPRRLQNQYWERIVYCDLAAIDGFVCPFPITYRLSRTESLLDISERYVHALALSNKALLEAPVHGYPPLHRIAVYCSMVLYAVGRPITDATSLLRQPQQWIERFHLAQSRYPEVSEAVAFFTQEYIPMRQTSRERLTNPFFDHLFPFTIDPHLQALVSGNQPGIRFDVVESKQQTVLLDFRRVQDTQLRFLLLWVFMYLYSWIKQRGRRDTPFGIIFDEISSITQQVFTGKNPLAVELDDFINTWMRNANIWFSVAHQELFHLDEQLRNTLLSLGTYIIVRQ
jgi:hypothetical protein